MDAAHDPHGALPILHRFPYQLPPFAHGSLVAVVEGALGACVIGKFGKPPLPLHLAFQDCLGISECGDVDPVARIEGKAFPVRALRVQQGVEKAGAQFTHNVRNVRVRERGRREGRDTHDTPPTGCPTAFLIRFQPDLIRARIGVRKVGTPRPSHSAR